MAERRIGVISDTHGLLRPQAVAALEGVEQLLHAGDVGDPRLLGRLREIAPLTVVRGNVDHGGWAFELPTTEAVEIEGRTLFMLHDLEDLDLDPAGAGISAVIYGHSHRPVIEWREDVLYLNPGSAGPRRFRLPVTVALLRIGADRLDPEIIELEV